MTMQLVANRNGHSYYRGQSNGKWWYAVVPQGSGRPTGGVDNSYAACKGVYNLFKLLR